MADFDSEFFIDYSSLDDFQRQLMIEKTTSQWLSLEVLEVVNH